MEQIEPDESLFAHRIRAHEKKFLQAAGIEEGPDAQGVRYFPGRLGDVGADGDRPVGELIPGQKVSSEGEPEGDGEQPDAHDPIELPGTSVRGRVKDARHVEEDGDDHCVGGPTVQISDEPSAGDDERDVLDRLVGCFGVRLIVEHEQYAGRQGHQEGSHGCHAEPQGRGPSEARAVHPNQVDVEEHVAEDKSRACTVARRESVSRCRGYETSR